MLRRALLALALLAAAAAPARAQDFATQSPGPLSRSHQALEGQDRCGECHSSGGELSAAKCLACHGPQGKKIKSGRGLHSSSAVRGQPCRRCHLEHRGRSHDIMGWATLGSPDRFDHRLTDWPLRGKHAAVGCDDCHRRRSQAGVRLYLGENARCEGCHADDQPHGFTRSSMATCKRCHAESSWKPAALSSFDHDRDTGFDLVGSHRDVACDKCHPKDRFELGASAEKCSSCHQSPHDGQLFGTRECASCHSPALRSLKSVRFDHDRKTRFDLEGKHRQTGCYGCHPQRGLKKPRRDCQGCHAGDSGHGDRFAQFGSPPDCKVCHAGSSRWQPPTFDHRERTDFELTGKHARIDCRACHRGKRADRFERFDASSVGCRGCHQHQQAHDGKFADGECLGCHKAPGVVTPTPAARDRFHGRASRFPLVQAHARVACDSCHQQDQWKGLSQECGPSCHADVLHRGSLGGACSRCHTSGVWDATRFSHDRESQFRLRGFHRQVDCAGCHPRQQFKPRPTECAGCHQDDDAHRGRLGTDCARCHSESGAVRFDHNRQARFALENSHLQVACARCHPSTEFKPRPTACAGCHPEPEVHRGRYGTGCQGCHDTRGWQTVRARHDVGNFSLAGAHDAVSCERCHTGGRKLGGRGNLCITCHREDDIHASSLGGKCGDCHTQWSFAPARFDHLTVGCDLSGVHRTLPCFDCHKSGNFGPLTSQCYGCHRDEVAGDGIHRGAAFFACGDCHSLNTWARPNTTPAMTSSVCR